MTLHLINKSPQNSDLWQRMLANVAPNDCVLLIEDGVLAALPAHNELFTRNSRDCILYVLEADVQARGLTHKIDNIFSVADDQKFVQLSCAMDKVVSWY